MLYEDPVSGLLLYNTAGYLVDQPCIDCGSCDPAMDSAYTVTFSGAVSTSVASNAPSACTVTFAGDECTWRRYPDQDDSYSGQVRLQLTYTAGVYRVWRVHYIRFGGCVCWWDSPAFDIADLCSNHPESLSYSYGSRNIGNCPTKTGSNGSIVVS